MLNVKQCASVLWRALLITLILSLSFTVSMAEDPFERWLSVPETQGGLVFVLGFPVSSLTITDEKKSFVDTVKWDHKSLFIRQVRLKPGEYSVRVPGPLAAVNVQVKAGTLTYLTFDPIKDVSGTTVAVSYGKAYFDIGNGLQIAAKNGIGDVFATPEAEPIGNTLVLSTEPPWPIPPPPPPKR